MRTACEKFGLFQVVNHGFPLSYIDETTDTALQFFAKPWEVSLSALEVLSPEEPLQLVERL